MKSIDDPRLSVYIIWVPMLKSDSRLEGVVASTEFEDSRLQYFWDKNHLSGDQWGEILNIGQAAWDVYFLYGPDKEWTDSPGQPDYFMHQLGGLPRDRMLNEETLIAETKKLLSEL